MLSAPAPLAEPAEPELRQAFPLLPSSPPWLAYLMRRDRCRHPASQIASRTIVGPAEGLPPRFEVDQAPVGL